MSTPRFNRRTLAFAHDTAMAAFAFTLALSLRMSNDFSTLPPGAVLSSLLLFTATCATVFWALGL
ncbi:MAG TPA: hypothetical protein VFR09_02585, partial [Alphaproteobacteria bacterium]|nr:hypothetical protein [Alphaproteobacteria bacterium]